MSVQEGDTRLLYELAQAMTAGKCHDTAVALRRLAQAGYTSLEQVDRAPDWVLLATPGLGVNRLRAVRQLTRSDWQPPSGRAVEAASRFLAAVRFALRFWPSNVLVEVIRGTIPASIPRRPAEKSLALRLFSQAAEAASNHCSKVELVQAIKLAEAVGASAQQSQFNPTEPITPPAETAPSETEALPARSQEGERRRRPPKSKADSAHFAHPRKKRREIVQHYRAARDNEEITNKDLWAQEHYRISGKTLLKYEREFPEDEAEP